MIALDLSGKTMQQCLIWPWTTVTMRCCWTGSNTQVREPDAHSHANMQAHGAFESRLPGSQCGVQHPPKVEPPLKSNLRKIDVEL